MVIENLGPVPIRVYSHTERRKIMKARGLEEFVRHTPVPGTGKSPFTVDFACMDPQTLKNAEELVKRVSQQGTRDQDDEAPYDSAIRFTNEVVDKVAMGMTLSSIDAYNQHKDRFLGRR